MFQELVRLLRRNFHGLLYKVALGGSLFRRTVANNDLIESRQRKDSSRSAGVNTKTTLTCSARRTKRWCSPAACQLLLFDRLRKSCSYSLICEWEAAIRQLMEIQTCQEWKTRSWDIFPVWHIGWFYICRSCRRLIAQSHLQWRSIFIDWNSDGDRIYSTLPTNLGEVKRWIST